MLTEICQYLKNWFNRKPDGTDYPKYKGEFTIADGVIDLELADGQYFRIMGSLFNDGVHKFGIDGSGQTQKPYDALTDETFIGEVWQMGVPPEIVSLANDITEWMDKYGAVDSPAMSPYQSESFDGYTYTKQQGYASAGGGMLTSWNAVFSSRLAPWRKI